MSGTYQFVHGPFCGATEATGDRLQYPALDFQPREPTYCVWEVSRVLTRIRGQSGSLVCLGNRIVVLGRVDCQDHLRWVIGGELGRGTESGSWLRSNHFQT